MVARLVTWAFDGAEARRVDVQVQITDAGANPYFSIVGLADKEVGRVLWPTQRPDAPSDSSV
jgi:magnesium chelatase family protein